MRRGPAHPRGRGRDRAVALKASRRAPVSTPSLPDRARRESDASICSSRPSSVAATPFSLQNAPTSSSSSSSSSNTSLLRFVNSYLSSINAPFSPKHPIPSAREISDAFSLVCSRLGSPLAHPDDVLPHLLRALSCPFKVQKSALRNASTPHAWPTILLVLHFLAELAWHHDHLNSSPAPPFAHDNHLLSYTLRSYSHYIAGDDEAVDALDSEYLSMARDQVAAAAEGVERLQEEVAAKEAQVKELRNAPTPKEALEKEREVLMGDVAKFRAMVKAFSVKVTALEELVEAERRKLEAKKEENRRICKENAELRERVAGQAVDVEGAERMTKELGMLERDIEEVKAERKVAEEKMEEIDAAIERRLTEAMDWEERCNDALRKLKLGNDIRYVLNTDGCSPSEVVGANYKSVLKPSIRVLAEDTKKSHADLIDLKITLQQQLQQQAAIEKEKKERAFELQAKIENAFARCNLMKKEIEDYSLLCESETKRMITDAEARIQQLEIVEKRAREFLKSTEVKLQEEMKLSDESIRLCAQELRAHIDVIMNDKEYIESTISGMKSDLCETINAVAETHKTSLASKLSTIGMGTGQLCLKRARPSSVDLEKQCFSLKLNIWRYATACLLKSSYMINGCIPLSWKYSPMAQPEYGQKIGEKQEV